MENFLIYRSSAGSGKTFTLVKEYLKLVLNSPDSFKNILAVTFTNKSAAEMKQRIISALKELSKGEAVSLEKLLISEGVKGDIRHSAARVLQNILHKYSYFSVSTIDSFFHRVIRSFARELRLQLGYNIELDQQAVLDKITDKLLDEAGENKELTGFLEDFIYYSIDDEKGWKIDLKIKELAKEIFSERYFIKTGSQGSLFEGKEKLNEFVKLLFAIKNDFEGRMKEISFKAGEIVDMYSLTIDDFPFKRSGFMNFLLNRINTGDDYDPKQRARDAVQDIKKWYGKGSKPAVKAAAEAGLYDLLCEAVALYDSEITKYNTAVHLIKTIYVTGIFKDLRDRLKKYRDENNVLLISDINSLLLNVISGEGSPFVYEKIGTYYKNFLIDEFQDTSTFQWQNFFPLVENALSEGNGSMIVGDVKQSIYRWRNGNMKLLLEDVKNSLGGFDSRILEKNLDVNYRSKKLIVEFNNTFFKQAAENVSLNADDAYRGIFAKAYNDSAQVSNDNSDTGYISIRQFAGDRENEIPAKEFAIADMINNIKQQLTLGYRQRDILVLVRKNPEAVEAAHALIEAKLKVISGDSLLLTNSPKVRLLVNIFKFISDPANEIARPEILYNYLVYIKQSFSELNSLFSDKLNSNELFIRLMPKGFLAGEGLSLNSELSGKGIYDLTESLLRIFGLLDSADVYLLRFLDVIKKYSDENSGDVYGFINWWEDHKEENTVIVPEEEDAIRVMTIHKAKGLQAPVVYIPFANWDFTINQQSSLMWVSSDKKPFNSAPAYFVKAASALKDTYFSHDYLEEEALTILDNLNLLYVAFTRAEEKLFVGIPLKEKKSFNAGSVIIDSVSGNTELLNNYNAEHSYYEKGNEKYFSGSSLNSEENPAYRMKRLISGDFTKKIKIKTELEGFEPEKIKRTKEHKNRGIVLHKALSYIKDSSEEEISSTLNRLLLQGYITSEKLPGLNKELREIILTVEAADWFKPGSKIMNENDIIMPGGLIYRPDKVIIKNDTALIIDFKSGIRLQEHEKQLKQYGNVLLEMGYKKIEMYLYYLTEKKIITIA